MTYQATVTREGDLWVIDVDGVGVTQARRLGEARRMVASLVYSLTDCRVSEDDVELVYGDELLLEARRLQQRQAEIAKAMAETAADMRRVVYELVKEGLTGPEMATVLGVSHQRVSQLAAGAKGAKPVPARKAAKARKRTPARKVNAAKRAAREYAPANTG